MSSNSLQQQVGIYEPLYLKNQVISQECFLPYQHTTNNLFSSWREFRLHVDMYRNNIFKKHLHSGIFSPKFELKTKIKGIDFIGFCGKNAEADVIFANPFPQLAYMSFNIWMQAEANHPGIVKVAEDLLNDACVDLAIDTEQRHDLSVLCYGSFWCGKAHFWDNFVGGVLDPLAKYLENNPNSLSARNAMRETFHTDPTPYLPFITERLFTTYIAQNLDLDVVHYPVSIRDCCLNQDEINYYESVKEVVDSADRSRQYSLSLKENMKLHCASSVASARVHYRNHKHPHTGRIIL